MTLLVPHYAGGGAGETFDGTNFYKRIFPNIVGQMTQSGTPAAASKRASKPAGFFTFFIQATQPFVGTAIYFGVILMFLSIVGVVLGSHEEKMVVIGRSDFLCLLWLGERTFS